MKIRSKLFSESFHVFFVNVAVLMNLFNSICMDISQDVPFEVFLAGYMAFPDVTLGHKGHIM